MISYTHILINLSKSSLGSRNSIVPGKSITTDPRQTSDKAFMTQCIRAVITYLTTHNFPMEISPKVLSSPTGRDFNNIVTFLAQQLYPEFTITKAEDDIPNLFKTLKYPFQISKRGLSSVGAPHTWPTLLAALAWFVELLQVRNVLCADSFPVLRDV